MKQYLLIWNAIRDGAWTSREVEEQTGVCFRNAAAQMYQMRQMGLLKVIGKTETHNSGRPMNIYNVIENAPTRRAHS